MLMDSVVTSSIISAGGAVIVAGLALGSNTFWISRSFDSLAKTIDEFKVSVKERFDAIDKRLTVIETDLKEVVKITNDLDRRIDKLEHKP